MCSSDLFPSHDTDAGNCIWGGGVEIRSVPSSRWTKGQGGWGCVFRRLVEEEARKADVVHNHGVWLAANYYARRAANKAGKPLVISTRGMVEDWSLGRSKMRKRVAWMLFERENLRSAKLFHATSSSEAESIEKFLSFTVTVTFTKPPIVVAPNGVDVPERIPGREILDSKADGDDEGEGVCVVHEPGDVAEDGGGDGGVV